MEWQSMEETPVGEDVLMVTTPGAVGVGWLQGNGEVYLLGSGTPRKDIAGWMPLVGLTGIFEDIGERVDESLNTLRNIANYTDDDVVREMALHVGGVLDGIASAKDES